MAFDDNEPQDRKRTKADGGRLDQVRDALRDVWGSTLGEEVPADMLALLGKLE